MGHSERAPRDFLGFGLLQLWKLWEFIGSLPLGAGGLRLDVTPLLQHEDPKP